MMQSDAALDEFLGAILLVASHDSERGASAHAVERVLVANHRLHAEKRQQLFIERKAGLEVGHREHHMRDPVDFHLRTSFDASGLPSSRLKRDECTDEQTAIHQSLLIV